MFLLYKFSPRFWESFLFKRKKKKMQGSMPQGREKSTIVITYESLSSQLAILNLWVAWRIACNSYCHWGGRRKKESMAGKKDGTQLCVLLLLLLKNISEATTEIMSHNTGLLKCWSSLYCSAQQATGLRPQAIREKLLRQVGSCPGSSFNHQTRTVALPQEKNNWILHATRCIYFGGGGSSHASFLLSNKHTVEEGS